MQKCGSTPPLPKANAHHSPHYSCPFWNKPNLNRKIPNFKHQAPNKSQFPSNKRFEFLHIGIYLGFVICYLELIQELSTFFLLFYLDCYYSLFELYFTLGYRLFETKCAIGWHSWQRVIKSCLEYETVVLFTRTTTDTSQNPLDGIYWPQARSTHAPWTRTIQNTRKKRITRSCRAPLRAHTKNAKVGSFLGIRDNSWTAWKF